MTSIYFLIQNNAAIADIEQMAGLLKEAHFEVVDTLEQGDIIIINSCTIESPSVAFFFNLVDETKRKYPYKIIIASGCIPQAYPEKLPTISIIGTKQIQNIVQVVEESLNENIVHLLGTDEMPPLNLPKVRQNPILEIIPIGRSSTNACASCKTTAARGKLKSYPVEEIVSVAEKAVHDGVKEIWLSSPNTMCYGFDLGTTVAELLKELFAIPGKFKIRLDRGSPAQMLTIKDQLIPLLRHEKMFRFIHLPAQSGSNEILKKLRKGYTKEQFLSLITELKEKVPKITIATDIVVGFPEENDNHYWETLNLVRAITPDIMTIIPFLAQSKTSSKMEPLPPEVINHRSKVLNDIYHNISNLCNEQWIGWQGEIIITEKGNESGYWIGRNLSYKPIIIQGNFRLGDTVTVRITKSSVFELRGEVL
ncbi:MAG: MiaB/RimO family radical SAM methylthiotransferase [Nanoarchaeota archaeon]|nr:MiaB/RimO family radical SAM methylthiotransferase [Nanoarchaeota archaeon]